MASEKEDVPLTSAPAAPRVQYFDVSDGESSDADDAEATARAEQPNNNDSEEEDELEVFQDGLAVPVARKPPSTGRGAIAGAAPQPAHDDPFGLNEAKEEGNRQPPLPSPPVNRVVPTLFDGTGIEGSSSKTVDGLEDSDEFDYAFEGKAREGETHKRVFNEESIPVPVGLLADRASKQLHSLCEDEEEEEEEEGEGGEGDGEAVAVQGVAPLPSEPDVWEAASAQVAAILHSQPGIVERPPMQHFEIEQQQRPSASNWSDDEEMVQQPSATSGGGSAPALAADSDFFLNMEGSDTQPADTGASAPVELPAVAAAPRSTSAYFSEVSAAEEAAEANHDAAQSMFLDPNDIDLFGEDGVSESPAPSHSLSAQAPLFASDSPSSSAPAPGDGASPAKSKKGEKEKKDKKEKRESKKGPSIVSSQKVRAYLASMDVSPYLGEIVETEADREAGCFASLLAKVMGPPKLATAELKDERTRIFCCAKMKFDEADAMHFKILSAVYQRFTSLPKPQRFGAHWTDIGFQGNDPATDLRSCGMLGLMQLLYLWDHHPGNAGAIYAMSRHTVHEFPLAVVGMNITKWCLQNLRAGRLTSTANRAGSVTWTVMEFYVGVWYHFFQTWSQQGATMAQSGYILKDVEEYCKQNTGKLLGLANSANLEAGAAVGGLEFTSF